MNLGIVVIGRNEEARLERTLTALLESRVPCIYIDSASTDDSVSIARSLAVHCLLLDGSEPLSAARSRNEGARWLLESHPSIEAIQFVDGDTTLDNGWLAAAELELEREPDIGVLCGSLAELDHQRSPYRRMCHMEWSAPVGDVETCGGNMLVRVQAFEQAGTFNPSLVVGEEREFCRRVRDAGWRIVRLDRPMGVHDSGITSFWQWWRRAIRSGVAGAQGVSMRGRQWEPVHVRRVVSALAWGIGVPLLAIVGALVIGPWGLLALGAYAVLWTRIAWRNRGLGWTNATELASFLLIAKFAESVGIVRYLLCPKPRRRMNDAHARADQESTVRPDQNV